MYQCDRRFWLENPANLLCDYTVLPLDNMSPGSKLNAVTRLVLFLTLFLYLADNKYMVWFFVLALLCIVCLYYYQRDTMKTVERFDDRRRENFENARVDFATNPVVANPVAARFKDLSTPTANPFRMDHAPGDLAYSRPLHNTSGLLLDAMITTPNPRVRQEKIQDILDYQLANARSKPGFDQSCTVQKKTFGNAGFTSRFEQLYKGSDPRTLVPPNITPRIFDWSAWDVGDQYQPSYVNTKRPFDMVGSGYLPQADDGCGYIAPKAILEPDTNYKWDLVHQFPDNANHTSSYRNQWKFNRPQTVTERELSMPNSIDAKADLEMSLGGSVQAQEDFKAGCTTCPSGKTSVVENFSPTNFAQSGTYRTASMNDKKGTTTMDSYGKSTPVATGSVYEGDLLGMAGYNRDNLLYNVPVNTSVGSCDLTDGMKDYNDNLYTMSVQPGVLYKSQIQLPINSNIGISFNQSLPITTQSVDAEGNTVLTNMDPRTFKVVEDPVSRADEDPSVFDIYDTRDTGYGPSYRGYVHELTGQPRWYYGDIDAVQKGEYVTFNNIDILDKADQRGFMHSNEDVRERAMGFQKYVDNNFTERTNNARLQLQQNFADKNRDPTIQRRRQPIMRLGGMTQKCFR